MFIRASAAFCLFPISLIFAIIESNRPVIETPSYVPAALSVLFAAVTLFYAFRVVATKRATEQSSNLRTVGKAILAVGAVAAVMTYAVGTDETSKVTYTRNVELSSPTSGVDRFDSKWDALPRINVTSNGDDYTFVTLYITPDSSVTQYRVALNVERSGLAVCENEGVKSRVVGSDSTALTLPCSTYIPKTALEDIEEAKVELAKP